MICMRLDSSLMQLARECHSSFIHISCSLALHTIEQRWARLNGQYANICIACAYGWCSEFDPANGGGPGSVAGGSTKCDRPSGAKTRSHYKHRTKSKRRKPMPASHRIGMAASHLQCAVLLRCMRLRNPLLIPQTHTQNPRSINEIEAIRKRALRQRFGMCCGSNGDRIVCASLTLAQCEKLDRRNVCCLHARCLTADETRLKRYCIECKYFTVEFLLAVLAKWRWRKQNNFQC